MNERENADMFEQVYVGVSQLILLFLYGNGYNFDLIIQTLIFET